MSWDDLMSELSSEAAEQLGGSVTLRRVTEGAYTPSTGARAKTTVDTTVTAIRGRTVSQIDDSGRVERTTFSVLVTEVSQRPDGGDRVIEGGRTWDVTDVEMSIDRTMYEIKCQRTLTAG